MEVEEEEEEEQWTGSQEAHIHTLATGTVIVAKSRSFSLPHDMFLRRMAISALPTTRADIHIGNDSRKCCRIREG